MKHIGNLMLAILTVFAPAKSMILTAGILIFVDLVTGVMASRKKKEPITSSGFRRTLAKMLIYESVIILAYLTQKYLTGDSIPVSNIAASFVGITELTSIIENMNELSDNKLLKVLLDKLGSANK